MNATRSSLLSILLLLAAAAALAGLTWANYRFAVDNPGGNDFLARWNGARSWLLDGISPYDPSVSLETQRLIYGRPADPAAGEDVAHFVYPLHSMVFFGPFGLLEFPLARALWMTVLEVSLVALVFASLAMLDWRVSPLAAAGLVIFSLAWYHGTRTIMVGQFAAVNALLITAALLLIRRGADNPAGFLLALSTAKPQMSFLIVPLVLLWAISTRRRGILGGLLAGLVLLIGVSLLLLPSWPVEMLWQLLDYPNYTDIGSPLSIIAGAAPGIRGPLNIALNLVAILYLLWTWIDAWGKEFSYFMWAALMTLVITNLVAIRTATTNYIMLLPVIFVLLKSLDERWGRVGRVLMWLLLLLLAAGLWALFLSTVDGNVEHRIMYLPLPAITLLGLWWVRWWTVRRPRLLYEELSSRLDQ